MIKTIAIQQDPFKADACVFETTDIESINI